MNPEYDGYETNAAINTFMNMLAESDSKVTVDKPQDNQEWKLVHAADEKADWWAWRKTTNNDAVLYNKVVYYFKDISHTDLYTLFATENRYKWDPKTEFDSFEEHKEYEVIYQKFQKIPVPFIS